MVKQYYKIKCGCNNLFWSGSIFNGWRDAGKVWSLKGIIKYVSEQQDYIKYNERGVKWENSFLFDQRVIIYDMIDKNLIEVNNVSFSDFYKQIHKSIIEMKIKELQKELEMCNKNIIPIK